jgi:leucyl aminopeptidase
VIALGDDVIGMLGTGEKLKKEINRAAQDTEELVWELPLWEQYHELIKSDIADYKNGRQPCRGHHYGRRIFEQICRDYPWAHLTLPGRPGRTRINRIFPKARQGSVSGYW